MKRLLRRILHLRHNPVIQLGLAFLIVTAAAFWLYHDVLFPVDAAVKYPWSSDGWGHLMKSEYLYEQIQEGNFFPRLFPGWYNGIQLLRYYAPLPYYALTGLYWLSGDIFIAGNWFMFLCGLLGGLSFLLFWKRFGALAAAIGGILFIMYPDNLRVAFAEGNMPRVFATALLPMTFYFLLNILDQHRVKLNIISLALSIMLITLSHAMIAAIFVACLALFAFFYWFLSHASGRAVGQAAGAIICGVFLAGWWLLPSLVGGITEINQSASSEALASFPLTVSLNPLLRLHNKEIFYAGISLVIGSLAVFWFRKQLSPLNKSLVLVGVIIAALGSTLVAGIYRFIPLVHLLWPIRFMSFGGFALLMGMTAFIGWLIHTGQLQTKFRYLAIIGLVLLLFFDFLPSKILVGNNPESTDLMQVSNDLRSLPGWREATLDLSLLGSAPSYLFTVEGGREQIFGWAYQGCATVSLIASINFALEEGYSAYAVDRLDRMGVDDVVLLRGAKIAEDVESSLLSVGFEQVESGPRIDLFHKDGAPRAYVFSHRILGIGNGNYNLALLFPEIEIGKSAFIDDYDLDFLKRYERLVLSKFSWHHKKEAEDLVKAYAAQGGKVIIDLTGTPDDVLAKEPNFLGVYGEPVHVLYQATLVSDGKSTPLLPFRADYLPWNAYTPQGLDAALVTFPYGGIEGIALGYKEINGSRVDFIGLNLLFHAVLTQDPTVIRLIEDELGMSVGTTTRQQTIPLINYHAREDGYRFGIEASQDVDVVVPVAYHDGTVVKVDTEAVKSYAIDSMTSFSVTAGRHEVFITLEEKPISLGGRIVSVVGVLELLLLMMWASLGAKK